MAATGDLARAVEEGRKAFVRGDTYLACAYPRPSALRTAWISGYYERARTATSATEAEPSGVGSG